MAFIHRQMPISEIVTLIPEAKSVLGEYGLHCFSCAGSEFENIQEGCKGHGFSDEEIDALVDDLNDMFEKLPPRPEMLTLTAEGARAIKNVADAEGQKTAGLEVIADASGGFCMEFISEPDDGLKSFENTDVSGVRIFASATTLKRIGGATIDFREGRFKLDLPEDAQKTGCACSPDGCACRADATLSASKGKAKSDQNAK